MRFSTKSAWRIGLLPPETIPEGSSVWNTDGSMPTDYGSDISDVPMEDGEVPSSVADSELAAVAHEPVTWSRRPREDDPSASSSKRSRNDEEEKAPTPVTPSSPRFVPTERAPWMPSVSEIASRFGATSPPNLIPLYVCSAIIDDAEATQQRFEIFQWRRIIDHFHNKSMEACIPCAVPCGTARPFERDLTGRTTVRVPAPPRDLRVQLEPRHECRDTPSVSGDRSACRALRLHRFLGFVRPRHFRNVLHQDVPRFPCISVGMKSSPTNANTSLISVRLRDS
ncbi:hypothetical protein PI124_g1759 [Phytophthora idaei]|nr:hypothetical protein PI125_g3986 [Phytophthora idaei]KAG3166103.1 hypothetical protein PI126_g4308 [Phytophthora idaei]KAG3253674.1 hypothetical protein PI124_g1759 [Phytophthora idaei]